jgi:hypothetical protein
MAFKNEKISDQDRAWVGKLVNYESIRAISRWVHQFEPLSCMWTADREREAFLIGLGGGGSPNDIGRLPYAVLVLDGQLVVFNLVKHWVGNLSAGIDTTFEIHGLIIPDSLEHRRAEIMEILREALTERSYSNPFADGGTVANPNMVARQNVKSVKVEFK